MDTVGGTILLVEDEDALRMLAQRVLEREGYRVIPAANGREALDRASGSERSIDILVTDLSMPGMGGLDLLREFARTRPGLPALVMSGYSGDEACGGMTFPRLEKPFLPRALVQRVRELLDQPRVPA